MNEDVTQNQQTDSNSLETPNAPQAEVVATAQPAAQGMLPKDLLIPISIIIAGIFIGAGLYFSGGSGKTNTAVQPIAQNQQAAEQADNTDKVNPVTEADFVKGNRDAAIMVVEYSDFDCPFCSRFHDVMNEIVAENDNVAWSYRHFPIEQLHPNAPAVAVASECVAEIGGEAAFWNFTDAYFAVRGSGDQTPHATLIPELVSNTGVDVAAWQACFDAGEVVVNVQEDLDNAVETGGRGTPWSILIGPDGETYPINGALPKQAIMQVINTALQAAQ